MTKKIIRRREHKCSANYKEIDLYPFFTGRPLSEQQRAACEEIERQESSLAQKNINEKNSRRHLTQLTAANFTEKGLHLSLTYKAIFLPKTPEDAIRDRTNFLRSVKRLCKKRGVPAPKYIGVTEYQTADPETGAKEVRFHHHIIIECDLDRDDLESLWSRGRGAARESLGFCNADRLQFTNGSIESLCRYITKAKKHARRWTQSLNLKQPVHKAPNDTAHTTREIERICTNGDAVDAAYWQKRFKGWTLGEAKPVYNDFTGWSIYLKLYKNPAPKPKGAKHKRTSTKTDPRAAEMVARLAKEWSR